MNDKLIALYFLLICLILKAFGEMKSFVPQHYYDRELKNCIEFTYGGCEGNANRFNSYDECINVCSDAKSTKDLNIIAKDSVNDKLISTEDYDDDDFDDDDDIQQKKSSAKENVQNRFVSSVTDEVIDPHPSSSIPELCHLPEDKGPCFGEILRWRYDSEQSKCVSFLYTGCEHNANYFTSEEACERACGIFRNDEVCSVGIDKGTCDLGLTKWYHDKNTHECHVFMFSGCGGNGNRFSSKAECQHLCASEIKAYSVKNVCRMERDSGPCMDAVVQWYFDGNDQQCKQFTYGGCRGNANRFLSKFDCETRCVTTNKYSPTNKISQVDSKNCFLSFDSGPCDAYEQKWYYDNYLGYCKAFIYGGCGGNENRFDNEKECTQICSTSSSNQIFKHRAILTMNVLNPVQAGSDLELKCEAPSSGRAQWYHNGINLDLTIKNDNRLKDPDMRLLITNVHESDSGNYTCSKGPEAIFSNPLIIDVMKSKTSDSCADKGNSAMCNQVVRSNLCSNARYGTFCCKTCAERDNQSAS